MSTFTTYAQNFEDVLLWRALKHIDRGFYIDVGAQDPMVESVSRAFHERGWSGIHVEPTATYADMLRRERPNDIVLQAAVSDESGTIAFFEVPGTGMSTACREIAESSRAAGYPCNEVTVACMLLDDVLDHADAPDIHWLKIDVEGYERQVLAGWRSSTRRPWIVVVEATQPGTQIAAHAQWEPLLLAKGYVHAYADGLNRFYVAWEHSDLLSHLSVGANVFDGFQLTARHWSNTGLRSAHEERLGQFGVQMAQMRAGHGIEQTRLQTVIAQANGQIAALTQNREVLAHKLDRLAQDGRVREQALGEALAKTAAAADAASERSAGRLAELEQEIASKEAEIALLRANAEQQRASLQTELEAAQAQTRLGEKQHAEAVALLEAGWRARCDRLENELQLIRKSLGWRLASLFRRRRG